jgi:hypothetical protein
LVIRFHPAFQSGNAISHDRDESQLFAERNQTAQNLSARLRGKFAHNEARIRIPA